MEQFIRAKYERKMYISRDGSSDANKATASSAAKETQEKAKAKPKKVSSSSVNQQKSSREQVMSQIPVVWDATWSIPDM